MRKNINVTTLSSLRKGKYELKPNSLLTSDKATIIENLISGIAPPLIVAVEKGDVLSVLYGGEIISTIDDFTYGKLKIQPKDETYFDFDDEQKAKFLETAVAICTYRLIKDTELNDVIARIRFMNQVIIGVDKVASKASETSISIEDASIETKDTKDTSAIDEALASYLSHPIFSKCSIPQLNIDLITSMLMVTEEGLTTDLSNASIITYKESMENVPVISEELDYIDKAFPSKESYLKKLHLPMIFLCGKYAFSANASPERFKKTMDSFFMEADVPSYKKACMSGTAQKGNVNTRIRVMLDFVKENL
jgi:hypothetical protein